MNPVEVLAALGGEWCGTNTLQDPHTHRPDPSPSVVAVSPVLGGRFVRLDYTWMYQNRPQEGSLLIGFDRNSGAVSAHWIDSWHMDHAAMTCTGTVSGNVISVRGTYAAPPGPDWGWRIDLSVEPAKLRLTMFNISPADLGGGEALAVEAVYRRA
ncbi:MAG: DUF1579 family protein [Gemmataceae bacterium]